MKKFLKQHKEIVFLIGVALVAGIAAHDLFSDQQQNSRLINSGTTLSPSNFSGRVSCEVPIPNVGSRMSPEQKDGLPMIEVKNAEDESASKKN